jgi:hypothetical protein
MFEMNLFRKFLMVPGILFTGVMIYFILKFIYNAFLGITGFSYMVNLHPISATVWPLVPISILLITVWRCFTFLKSRAKPNGRSNMPYDITGEE